MQFENNNRNKREETHSFVCAEEIIGREDDKVAILWVLLDNGLNVQGNVSTLSIVGIGGLGKTTLAQLVYNDEKVSQHFTMKMWVCVSDVFDVKVVIGKIIESATHKKPENLEMDGMQDQLRKEIDGKKYLLVLDDVWNEDRDEWLKLRNLLMGGARGSKILVTTRTRLVATITGTMQPYLLDGLSENESWSLFKKMAFEQGEEQKSPNLVAIGKEIVEKCVGVPLAIRALGSLLYSKDTEEEWLYFKNNDLPKIALEENVILPILKLSYDYLPYYLKRCFAVCSLYPKDHIIDKQELICLWIAHGLIRLLDENQQMEDVAHLYFMDLLRRSFFQDVEMNAWGNIESCKMHDLIHDLAKLVAGPESSILNLDAKHIPPKIRHVSFDVPRDSSWEIPIPLLRANKLRTFFLPSQGRFRNLHVSVPTFIRSPISRRLRVLDLHNLGIMALPSCISKLKQLRYLDLSKNIEIKTLPSSITKLQNLQTLKLINCRQLIELPRDIRKMASLRHLELEGCNDLTRMPCGLGELTSLRTLTVFKLGRECNGMFPGNGGLSELKGLNNLKGRLKIFSLGPQCLKSATTEQTEEENYLKGIVYLDSLQLSWSYVYGLDSYAFSEYSHDCELVFEGLQPNPNLKKLFIDEYHGVKFPSWMMVNIGLSLPNLVKLDMRGSNKCRYLPQFGQLPSLQVLQLSFLSSLEYIDNGTNSSGGVDMSICSFSYSSFFPSLKYLKLCQLRSLKGWWSSDAEEPTTPTSAADQQQHLFSLPMLPSFPRLSTLIINVCEELTSMPVSPHVEELKLRWVNGKLVNQLMMMSTTTIPMITTTAAATTLSSSPTSFVPLSKLKILCIVDIKDLVTLPEEAFQNLISLQFLEISGCRRLTSLSRCMRHLTVLEKLQLFDCHDLSSDDDGMHFQGLRNLTSLTISSIQKLGSLPIGLQHVTTLKSLEISRCDLKSLPEWICHLTSLQRVIIAECFSLTSLPEGMRQLTTLQELDISCCPNLSHH